MVFKCIEFPDKEFATKEAMFAELIKHSERLINIKKAQVFKSCEKQQVSFVNLDISKMNGAQKANFEVKEGYIYPVISTTNYMDSHGDVHFNGSMNKTAREQNGRVMYALDHELKFNSILAWPKDVNMFITPLDWGLVGKNYAGQTEALVFEISEAKMTNSTVLDAIKSRSNDFENSIRMVYHKIRLGVNSNDKDMAEAKAYFDSRINLIANKEVALEKEYFWGVEELAIHKEGSLVVAGGSNDATSIIFEAADSTSQKEDPNEVQSKSVWDDFITPQREKTIFDYLLP